MVLPAIVLAPEGILLLLGGLLGVGLISVKEYDSLSSKIDSLVGTLDHFTSELNDNIENVVILAKVISVYLFLQNKGEKVPTPNIPIGLTMANNGGDNCFPKIVSGLKKSDNIVKIIYRDEAIVILEHYEKLYKCKSLASNDTVFAAAGLHFNQHSGFRP